MTAAAPAPMREPPSDVRGRTAPAVRASWTARALRMGAISTAAALFLTVTAAFGLETAPAWKRLAYWLGLLLLGSALSIGGQAWLLRRPEGALAWRSVVLALGLTLVLTPVTVLATHGVFGGEATVGDLVRFVGPVFVVAAAMTAINVLAGRRREAAPPAPAPAPPGASAVPPAARFRERLPLRLRGAEVWAVEAEDHYLRVHTDRGSDLLLLRLADALEELGGIDGARTHRSWWVARAAVADARRGDGRATLVLRDGTEAPVSRSYAPALREAGWF